MCPEFYNTRTNFLTTLQSATSAKYKRYNGLPLRYAGGKSLAVGHIIQHFPDNLERLVSPFIGGGAVEVACARELGIQVQAYDVFDILVNYWQVVLAHPSELATAIARWQPTKSAYMRVKTRLKQHWEGAREISDEMSLAAHYWFNHNLSYGPGFLGWMSKIYACPKRYQRLLDKIRYFDCPNLSVAQASFETSIPKHDGTFLYCDPPYYLDDGKMFKGIYPQRNFPVHHKGFDHLRLRQLLAKHKGGFILSYNDCDTIRELYSDCDIIEVAWQYTLGQGETRIGKNRIDNGTPCNVKKSPRLLIVRYG